MDGKFTGTFATGNDEGVDYLIAALECNAQQDFERLASYSHGSLDNLTVALLCSFASKLKHLSVSKKAKRERNTYRPEPRQVETNRQQCSGNQNEPGDGEA